MGDSLTDEESREPENQSGVRALLIAVKVTADTRRTDLHGNSFHHTMLRETSDEEAALIRAVWEDRSARQCLNSLCQPLEVANWR